MPILDDRGTLIGVANESGELIEKLYYNSTGLMKSYSLDGTKWKPTLDKYGNQLRESKYLPFGWTGMYKDRFTGLYHTQFREYDPLHERWLTIDPAGYRDGLNLYHAYMGVNGIDPLGLVISDSEIRNGVPYVKDSSLGRNGLWGIFGDLELQSNWRPAVGDELSGYFKKTAGRWCTQNGTDMLNQLGSDMTSIKKGGDKAIAIHMFVYTLPFAAAQGLSYLGGSAIMKAGGGLLLYELGDVGQSFFTETNTFEFVQDKIGASESDRKYARWLYHGGFALIAGAEGIDALTRKFKLFGYKYKTSNVVPSLKQFDLENNVIMLNKAEKLETQVIIKNGKLVSFKSGNLIDTSRVDNGYIFVMDNKGNIYMKEGLMSEFHHSSFLAGKPVAASGEIKVVNGRITHVNYRSGHYRQNIKFLNQFIREIKSKGIKLKQTQIGGGF